MAVFFQGEFLTLKNASEETSGFDKVGRKVFSQVFFLFKKLKCHLQLVVEASDFFLFFFATLFNGFRFIKFVCCFDFFAFVKLDDALGKGIIRSFLWSFSSKKIPCSKENIEIKWATGALVLT